MASICEVAWTANECACGCGELAEYICALCLQSCFASDDHQKAFWSEHRCDRFVPHLSTSSSSSSSTTTSLSPLTSRFEIGDRVYAEFGDELLPAIILLEEAGLSPLSLPEFWYFVHFEGKPGDYDCWQPGISLVPKKGIYEAKMILIREIRKARALALTDKSRNSGFIDLDTLTTDFADPSARYLRSLSESQLNARTLYSENKPSEPKQANPTNENLILNEVVFCEHKNELQCATVLASDSWHSEDGELVRHYYIRYEGCSDRWNEWVDAQTVFVDHTQQTLSSILLNLQQIDLPSLKAANRLQFEPGDRCLLLHPNGYYYAAVVLVSDISLSVDRIVTFHYRTHILGVSDDTDMWVLADKIFPWDQISFAKCVRRNADKFKRRNRILPSIGVSFLKGQFQADYSPVIDTKQACYNPGDLIFAEFHGLPYRARILCVDAWTTSDSKKKKSFFLYIEYCGWSTRWQEWIESTLAEPWTTRYQSVPPPPPLVRIYPPKKIDRHHGIVNVPFRRHQLPREPGLPSLSQPDQEILVLERIIRGKVLPSHYPASSAESDAVKISPLAVLYLCYRLAVAPSFLLFRHWMEYLVQVAVRTQFSVRSDRFSDLDFLMLERSILLDQATVLASIFSMFYLSVLIETSRPLFVSFDLSQGLSKIPVPAVNLLRKEIPKFVYTESRFSHDDIPLLAPRDFLASCACQGICSKLGCPCGLEMGHKILYNDQGLLPSAVLSKPIGIYECNLGCACSDVCLNRVVQRGTQIPTLVVAMEKKGWGLFSLVDIPKGTFVLECAGEIITHEEAERRGEIYDINKLSYLFDLDHEAAHDICRYTIDMTKFGNHARFINHSCNPNLAPFYVWINTQDKDLPIIALFAIRHIFQGEELTFDYRYPKKNQIECLCNSKHCREYLC